MDSEGWIDLESPRKRLPPFVPSFLDPAVVYNTADRSSMNGTSITAKTER